MSEITRWNESGTFNDAFECYLKKTYPDAAVSQPKPLYNGFHPSDNYKLQQAQDYLGTKYVLHPQYDGKHSVTAFAHKPERFLSLWRR